LKYTIVRDDSLDWKLPMSEMKLWTEIYYCQRLEPRLEATVVRDEVLD